MADESFGLLSLASNESIFQNDILRDYLPERIGRAARPRLILLGGQPGAGKTAVLTASHSELAQSGPAIRIVGDDLRSYHPQFLTFQREDPETASRFTQADAGRWTEKLLAAATERQVNVVFETTMRTPENVARVVRMARDADYKVEARAVAVNPRLSWQGNHYRFEEMLHAGLAARIPPQHVHDAAVDGLRISLEKLESEKLVDRVRLHTRGGAALYDNELHEGQWTRPIGGSQALEREHTRPMMRGELQRFVDDWNHVLARMEERKAPAERITAVEVQANDDVAHLLAQRRQTDGERGQRNGRMILQGGTDGHRLFIELYDNAVRDAERRPIGNVAAHAAGRLAQTYMALRLIEAARDLGLLPEEGKIVATRAMVQDKRATQEFPAAHRMPADLAVETPDGSRRRLADVFGVALNRVAVDREVFGPTDRMSRLANVADSWAEAAGMRSTLARAATAVARQGKSAEDAMTRIVEPGYAAAIEGARRRLDRNMTLAERVAIVTSIVDNRGEPFRRIRDDLRLRTGDLENRARSKSMMEAVLAETARYGRLDPESRRAADVFVEGIVDNERRLGLQLEAEREAGRTQALNAALIPARHLPDLTDGQIGERLRASARLADKRAEIDNLARLVFGNSQAVSASVQQIADARSGTAAGDDIREGRLGEMAGEARGWFRGPSPARQSAEAHAPRLAAALADYGHAVDFERHQIVMQHREEQARQRVEIPAPSLPLSGVLKAEEHEQVRRLKSDPALRRELETFTLALSRRLTSSDKTDLKQGNDARIAASLGLSRDQAAALRSVHERATALQERSLRQNRDLTRTNQLTIRR